LVVYWWAVKKVKPGTLREYMSKLRTLAKWIGKVGLVKKPTVYLPDVNAQEFKVKAAAVESKSWESNGVSVLEKIRLAKRHDPRFALMLMMEVSFGLRRKEVIHCQPHKSDKGNVLMVFTGQAKGSRVRAISIETSDQRLILDYVKSVIPKTTRGKPSYLGWEFTKAGKVATLANNITRYNTMMEKIGITKKEADVTGHGLRAQFAENQALLMEFIPATLGGNGQQMPKDDLDIKRAQVSEELGHSRTSITSAYYGSIKKTAVSEHDKALQEVIDFGFERMSKGGMVTMTEEHLDDCLKIVRELSQAGVEVRTVEAYNAWKKHSERHASVWLDPNKGIVQGIAVAVATKQELKNARIVVGMVNRMVIDYPIESE